MLDQNCRGKQMTYGITLTDRCTGSINAVRDTKLSQLVLQLPYERIEVGVGAERYDEDLGRCDCWRERKDSTGFVLLTSPVNMFT